MAAVRAPQRPPELLTDDISSSSSSTPHDSPISAPPLPPPPSPVYSTPPSPTWPTTLTYFLALLGLLALLARALKIAARNRRRRKDALRSRRRKEKRQERRQAVAAAVAANAAGQCAGDDVDAVGGDDGDNVPADVRDLRVVESEQSESEYEEDEDDEDESDIGDYAAILGSALTSILVHAAILLKRSPIPDLLFSLTNTALDGYARVNRALGVEAKLVRATQKALAAGVTATGVVAHAAIRAGLAYQMAPGRREKKILRMATGEGGATTTTTTGNENGVAAPITSGSLLAGYYTAAAAGLSLPGGIPRGAKTDAATQTGGSDSARSAAPIAAAPATSVRGVLSTYLFSTLRVAGNAATAGSEAMLGKTRTQKLLGVEKTSHHFGATNTNTNTTAGVFDEDDDDDDDDDDAEAAGPVLYLNVGGSVHATTLRTLTRVEGSLLAEWFGDASKRLTLELKDGSFFVDRDGTNFHHILAHLRHPSRSTSTRAGITTNPKSPTKNPLPTAADEISQLIVEAIFYRLPDLVDDLSRRLARVERDAVSVTDLLVQIAATSFNIVAGGGAGNGSAVTMVMAASAVGVLGVGIWWMVG
ncbi:BTB/POZ domain-containing protein kctd14 [Geranomyces variabilis]|nr:BTB/POZ domain-containing protein kctd14 [Geranomyces variabilis]